VTLTIDDQRQPPAATVADAVLAHAAAVLPCPRDQIEIRELVEPSPRDPAPVVLADGCGQRVVYEVLWPVRHTPGADWIESTSHDFHLVSRFPFKRAAR
jgi:hypothetical protein